MPILLKTAEELVDVIDETVKAKQCIDYREYSSRFMCDIIGQVAFGLECNFTNIFKENIE